MLCTIGELGSGFVAARGGGLRRVLLCGMAAGGIIAQTNRLVQVPHHAFVPEHKDLR